MQSQRELRDFRDKLSRMNWVSFPHALPVSLAFSLAFSLSVSAFPRYFFFFLSRSRELSCMHLPLITAITGRCLSRCRRGATHSPLITDIARACLSR